MAYPKLFNSYAPHMASPEKPKKVKAKKQIKKSIKKNRKIVI
jgi:hypothetical protein